MISEKVMAQMQAQLDAQDRKLEKMMELVSAVVENVNLLRGDAQRVQAESKPQRRVRVVGAAS